MGFAVTREKCHAPPGNLAERDQIARRPVRRFNSYFAAVFDERVKTRPAEYADLG